MRYTKRDICIKLAVVAYVIFGFDFESKAAILSKYLIGPADKLEIRLNDLRTGTGEAREWSAFNGEFVVDSSGQISLPIIGQTLAAGLTADQLSNQIAESVQAKVGLAKTPTASVQIVKYRPFYIIGSVEKPGEYDFRPGLTVLQAVGVAGGFARTTDALAMGLRKEGIVYQGELVSLRQERDNLKLRVLRLETEYAGGESFNNVGNLDNRLSAVLIEEQRLFNERKKADKDFLALNKRSGTKIAEELATLDAKDSAVLRQVETAKRELGQVNDLVARGLAVTPRQTSLEQNVAAYESTRVDVQLARVRAQQDLSRNEKDLLEFTARRRSEITIELANTREKIGALDRKIDATISLLRNSEKDQSSISSDREGRSVVYVISRNSQMGLEKVDSGEGSNVEPGDVISVIIPKARGEAIQYDVKETR